MRQVNFLFALFLSFLFLQANADVKLPRILSSNMVLQRNAEFNIWGWADKNEKVTVTFNGVTRTARTGKDLKWVVSFPSMKAGGPYTMTIKGKNTITLENILMGDVWVCSGQSNMEWSVIRSNNSEEEIANAKYPEIRLFHTPHNVQFEPVDDVDNGTWEECSPETISNFTAVGYFFGRHLHESLDIPIGLLQTAWGGTIVETWISGESVGQLQEFKDRVENLKSYDPKEEVARRKAKMNELLDSFGAEEEGIVDGKPLWAASDLDVSKWKEMELPQLWEGAGLEGLDGVVWFRKEFHLEKEVANSGITLELGPIDDSDMTLVNGKLVGEMTDKYDAPRIYNVSPEILKEGKNVVTVRVEDTGGGGGFHGKPENLQVTSGSFVQSLAGKWLFRISRAEITVEERNFVGPNSNPTLLYNGMIHPFLNYSVKGAIWYQGESNAGRAHQYQTLFPMLIKDWRKNWSNPDMPFFFVQLANFRQPVDEPGESDWAELREAQTMALELPNTGMAVIIDIGEADDIHPTNKQDVGRRLGLSALAVAYGEDIVYSGPLYKSITVTGDKAVIEFDNVGGGLKICDHYGYLKGFTIAGADKKFYWAKAYVENNKVVVFSDKVGQPVAVRYGWATNPDDVNLYNVEGLPASPFRTDDWPGITVEKK